MLTPDESASHDIAIIGSVEHRERLLIGMNAESCGFPLVIADHEGLELILNQFAQSLLNAVFAPRLAIDMDNIPISFVPIDEESPISEVAEIVFAQLLQAFHDRPSGIDLNDLCSRICSPTWGIMGDQPRSNLRRAVSQVLDTAVATGFRDYFRWTAQRNRLEFLRNPLDQEPETRTREFRSLQTRVRDLITRLRGQEAAVQGTLQFPQ